MSDAARLYEVIRARLEHEDGLIVQRLSWLMGSQSFLFTAYAIVLNGLAAGGKAALLDRMAQLHRMLPLLGALSTILILVGILAALAEMSRLAKEYAARVPSPDAAGLPFPAPPGPIRRGGQAAPVLLPLLFLLAWVLLILPGGSA